MDRKIKQIAEQAGFVLFSPEEDPDTPIDWSSDYTYELEKFAQLIVRECVDVVTETRWHIPPTIQQVAISIKEHFGVEE